MREVDSSFARLPSKLVSEPVSLLVSELDCLSVCLQGFRRVESSRLREEPLSSKLQDWNAALTVLCAPFSHTSGPGNEPTPQGLLKPSTLHFSQTMY